MDEQPKPEVVATPSAVIVPTVDLDHFGRKFVYWFAAGWSIVAIAFIFGITFFPIPPDNVRFADTVLGFLLGQVISTVMGFFFGSSYSSRKKDEALAKVATAE